MKIKDIKYKALIMAFVGAVGFTACDDTLEVLPLEYKEDPNFAPPHINPAWNLVEISDMAGSGVYAYKDKLYDGLFTRTLGWNGGDGVLTVQLPDGNLFWTFNDSFYGVVDGETRARGASSFPRNSTMLQEKVGGRLGEADENLHWLARFNQTTDPNAPGYYKAFTHIDHPNASKYNDDGIAQDYLYWSGDGTIVDGKLQMIWMGVWTPEGTSDMINQNAALAIYSLNGKVGDPDYLKLESIDHDFLPANPYAYGSTLWEDEDGHIYLYSSISPGAFQNVPIVARTAKHDLRSEWEYYVPNDAGEMIWQKEYPLELQAKNAGIAPDQGALTLPWVFKKGDWYYMVSQSYPFGSELNILRSEHPWGPFTDKKVILKFNNPLDELQHDQYGVKYQHLYMLNLHPGLSRDGELVISTNTDPSSNDDNGNPLNLGMLGGFTRNFNSPGSADWYRPFFFRIFKWERAFEN